MKILKTAQAVNLALWAALNIFVGCVIILQPETPHFYFFTMNISWNVVNAGVAVFIYAHHNEVFDLPMSVLNQFDYQSHIEKAIAFNLGLDLAFIAAGLALFYYGNIQFVEYPELWRGFGYSIIFQGSFLLIQDIVFYRLHRKNRRRIYLHWQKTIENHQVCQD